MYLNKYKGNKLENFVFEYDLSKPIKKVNKNTCQNYIILKSKYLPQMFMF